MPAPALQKTYTVAKEHWLTVGFLLGFVTDVILLNRVDDLFDNLILLFYALLATTSLIFFYVGVAQKGGQKLNPLLEKYMPIIMQYSFGGLLSGMLIFYGRSADIWVSAPFLLLIIVVILGNEFVKKRSNKLLYHLGLYFIGIFSYIVLVTPVILGTMGDAVFILSGLLAIVVVTLVTKLLYKIVPNFMRHNTRQVILTIGFTYIGLNVLYFTNIIPPIPLSLTDLTIAQSVQRMDSGDYRVVIEEQPWWQMIPFTRPDIHPTNGSVACFARVFAPTRLHTEIYHRWQFKNEAGKWEEYTRLGYPIQGSGEKGYRGYTTISNLRNGEWRCSVETKRGQVLGRQSVDVDTTTAGNQKVTVIK